ncbi:uncharacterized protein LOC111698930 [Eurytemora carolleeae]|uniref:uncharacterized protein LOC111698930 n=1 Tax=Eurytemora carolleeae TaxID=1294199 RepID=UPI000C763BD1|nr:uncharacterized protein LOC111698930 [Eurytemora carolleeae]|eukprot:XP_023325174.1 uncharacterized protein LOC111698930 [Eurytemora affinis]
MASILCNNLKSYTIPAREKKKWRMLEFPFKVGSRWLSCTKILRDAAMDFKTMAREIVNSRKRIESNCKQGNGRNAKCNECTNDDDCLDEYNEDYECVENECLLKSFTCFDNFDCDVNERCVDEFCVKREKRNNRGRGRGGRGGRGGGGRGGRG